MAGISARIGGHLVLNGLNLDIGQGESVALLGASGSGKTTALRVAAGFLHPEQGRVFVGSRDVTDEAPERRHMAMIHQRFLLFPHLKVAENVAFGLRYQAIPRSEHLDRVRKLLTLVGLEGMEDRYPHELSGGQQQRVAVARALAVQPRVLLLDEPLNNLDSSIREYLLEEMRSLQRTTDMTMLYVTHDQGEAARIAHRVALLDGGRILQQGPFKELIAHPISARAAGVLGLKNLYPAHRSGVHLEIPSLGLRFQPFKDKTGDVLAYLPPDRIKIRSSESDSIPFKGIVAEIVHGTLATRLIVRCRDAIVNVAVTRDDLARIGPSTGCEVILYFNTSAIRLLKKEG